jgi:alanine or glycine:cation symporter, AGCS family
VNSGETSTALTAAAFGSVLPFGESIVALCSLLFGLSTVFVGCYYREQILQFMFGIRFAHAFRYLYVALVFCGALFRVEFVWSITMTLVALMAIPNLIGVVLLSGRVARSGKTS